MIPVFFRRSAPWVLLAWLIVWPVSAPVRAAMENGEERGEIEAAEQEERRLLTELESIEKKIDRSADRLARIEGDIAAVESRLSRVGGEMKVLQRRIGELEKYLGARLRAVYKLRDGGLLQVLLKAESVPDMLHRYEYLSMILRRDTEALREYGQRRNDLDLGVAQLKGDRQQLYQLKLDVAAEKEKLVDARHEKTAVLIKVHQRKEVYLALLRQREESRQRLLKEVIISPGDEADEKPAQVEDKDVDWPDFAGLKGRIPRPAPGEIVGRFGSNPGPFNTTLLRHGLVFAVAPGVPVRAVLAGRVIYTGWMQGYGNIIIIDHGHRYYTLTGGVSGLRHKTGVWIKQGEVLGVVPKGSQLNKKDIYFEIRHRGQAMDPAPWLGEKPVG